MGKKDKIKYCLLGSILVICIVFAIFGKSSFTGTNAKYVTVVESSDSAAIAKWKIDYLNEKGATGKLKGNSIPLRQSGDEGSWFFEISNNSQVSAHISNQSKVRLRLDSDNFSEVTIDKTKWDFIKNPEGGSFSNPITFKLSLYREKLSNIIKYGLLSFITIEEYNSKTEAEQANFVLYQTGEFYISLSDIITTTDYNNKTDVEKTSYAKYLNNTYIKIVGSPITLDEYSSKTPTEQKNYIKIVDDELTKENILTINSGSSLTLLEGQEEKNGKLIKYYYVDFNINNNPFLGFDSDQYATFKIDWKIESDASGSDIAINNKYRAYKITSDETYQEEAIYTFDTIDYRVGYKEVDMFEYMNYLSSIPGTYLEPSFKVIIDDEEKQVIYSKLIAEQIEQIRNYVNITNPKNKVELEKYIEGQTIVNYELFRTDQIKFLNSLNYLEFGLTCSFSFNVIVEQVD